MLSGSSSEQQGVCVDIRRVVLWVWDCYVFLLLEGGVERVPVEPKDSQKLGVTLSRFGGTTAVLKDLDCLEKRPGKK